MLAGTAEAADAFSALSSGKVDALSIYGTGGPLIQIANGQKFTILGGYMIIGATPVFARPETEYKGIESLIGKKIAIGSEAGCAAGIVGPFTNAFFLYGVDDTLRLIRKNPQAMHKLCDISLETCIAHADAAIDKGLSPTISEPHVFLHGGKTRFFQRILPAAAEKACGFHQNQG